MTVAPRTHTEATATDVDAGLSNYPKLTDAERARRRAEAIAAGPPACSQCGKPTTFSEGIIGMTVGGLWLRGWYMCPEQHGTLASGLAEVCPAPMWTIAKGGRSVELGTARIRYGQIKAETSDGIDVVALMARIAKLPELEREVLELRAKVAACECPDFSRSGSSFEQETKRG